MSNKAIILGLCLVCLDIYTNISYALCSPDDFTSQADGQITQLLAACPLVNGKLPDSISALVGSCPNEALAKISSACNDKAFPQQTQQNSCQAFYKNAYYGKVQAACHYLAAVEAAKPPAAAS